MTDLNTDTTTQPGLIAGVASCVCAVLGFFIPLLGIVLAIVGLVLGLNAYRAGRTANYQASIILGVIGAMVSGVSLVIAAIATFAVIGLLETSGIFK